MISIYETRKTKTMIHHRNNLWNKKNTNNKKKQKRFMEQAKHKQESVGKYGASIQLYFF